MDESLDINEAADFLHISTNFLLEIAGKGQIPHAAKIGRAWVFLKSGLIEYIKMQAAQQNKLRQSENHSLAPFRADTAQQPRKRGGPRRIPPPLPVLPSDLHGRGNA